ncbi:MAG: T9SS type A sorting domain-containing protein [Flavobacteriales bacterium]|nr:T9SS type A sorting domain-containing protein [Flavobacteriales bacterium]
MNRTLPSLAALFTSSLLMAQATNYPNGSTVADFTVTDVGGNTHSLYSYTSQGKYVILDFFFDTCPPCQATSPYFSELNQTYGCNEGDLICLAMNNGTDSDAEVIAYEATYGGPFAHPPAVSMDGGGGTVTNTFGVGAFPTYCLIGPDNLMKNYDIWPVSDMSTFVAAFPPGSGINPQACVVGLDEAGRIAFTEVFPSPTTGIVTVTFNAANAGNLSVEVYDMLGQLAISQGFGSLSMGAQRTLDLSALADGQYVLKLVANGQARDTSRITVAR